MSNQINEKLIFDIIVKLNEGAYQSVKQVLDDLNRAGQSGSGGISGTTNAIKELDKEARQLATEVNHLDAQMRFGDKTLEEFNAEFSRHSARFDELKKKYKEHDVTTNALVASYKKLKLTQDHAETGWVSFGRSQSEVTTSTRQANMALGNLSRIVQDLPFGFLGISNNLDPALNSMKDLSATSGGLGGALAQIGKQLMSPAGLIFALGSLLPTAVLLSQNGMIGFRNILGDSKEKLEAYNKALREQLEIAQKFKSESAFDLVQKQEELDIINKEIELRERLKFVNQELTDVLTAGARKSAFTDERDAYIASLLEEQKSLEGTLKTSRYLNTELSDLETKQETLSTEVEELTRNINDSDIQFARFAETLRSDTANAIERYTLKLAGSKEGVLDQIEYLDDLRGSFRMLVEDGDQSIIPFLKAVDEQYKKATGSLEGWIDNYDEAVEKIRQAETTKFLDDLNSKLQKAIDPDNFEIPQIEIPPVKMPSTDSLRDYFREIEDQENALLLLRQRIENASVARTLTIAQRYEQMYQQRSEALERAGSVDYETELDRAKAIFEVKRYYMQQELQLAREEARQREATDRRVFEAKIQMATEATSIIGNLGTALLGTSEKNARKLFNLNKIVSASQATINSYEAFTATLKDYSLPTALRIPLAGVILASGLAKVAQIMATRYNSPSTGGGGSSSVNTGFYEQSINTSSSTVGNSNINDVASQASVSSQPLQPVVNLHVSGEVDREGIAWAVREGEDIIMSKTTMVG